MDQDEQRELVRRVFALITARLEDAATLAADGQSRLTWEVAFPLAQKVSVMANEVATLAQAAEAICEHAQR